MKLLLFNVYPRLLGGIRGYGGDRSSNLVMTILAGYESCQYRATQS